MGIKECVISTIDDKIAILRAPPRGLAWSSGGYAAQPYARMTESKGPVFIDIPLNLSCLLVTLPMHLTEGKQDSRKAEILKSFFHATRKLTSSNSTRSPYNEL